MAITIDWGAALIHVPKTDLTPLGGLFYYHDTEAFLRELQALADDEAGIPFPVPYQHNPVVTLSGVAYARIVEVVAPYQIVYDDSGGTDAYNVNLGGSNNNILDRKFPNRVTVNPNNSAGLTDVSGVTTALDYAGEVHVDPVNGVAGTVHPIGTSSRPVSDFADAVVIAETYGLKRLVLVGQGSADLDVDVSGYSVQAEGGGSLNFVAGNDVTGATFERLFLSGDANSSGHWFADYCGFQDGLTGLVGNYQNCIIYGRVTLAGASAFMDSVSGVAGLGAAEISGSSTGSMTLQMRRYTGGLNLYDFVDGDIVSVDLLPGVLRLKPTVTGGEFKVRGVGEPIEVDGAPGIVDSDGFLAADDVQLVRKMLTNTQDFVDDGDGFPVVMRTLDDDDLTTLLDQVVTKSDDSKPDITQGITKRSKGT